MTSSTTINYYFLIVISALSIFAWGEKYQENNADKTDGAVFVKRLGQAEENTISFNKDIRPILSDKCFACHGFDENKRKADLRLDTFAGATEEIKGTTALVPGDRKASELWFRINDKDDPMPPEDSHKALSEDEKELLGRWIEQGGEYEDHWAYTQLKRPDLPKVSNSGWGEHPLDQFIHAKLDQFRLKPSPQADKRTLMRRVAFDLTGLPPTPEQVKQYMSDDSPDAHEKYIDQLMATETYGEHLAVWWLDLVRYADTIGLHSDNPRSMWPYREWVINSLNDNTPFDQFTIMQLAGDLMQPKPTKEMLIASAYNRLNLSTEEGGAQAKEYQVIHNVDRVTNYGEVWLGSSTGCAQCHDHKFDPITQKDFFSLAAFFGSLNQAAVSMERGYPTHEPPFIFLPQDDAQAKAIAPVELEYRKFLEQYPNAVRVEEYYGSRSNYPRDPSLLDNGKLPSYAKSFEKLLQKRGVLAEKIPTVPIARELDKPRTVRVLAGGSWQDDSGEIVHPAAPEFLGGPSSTEDDRKTRLDLAKWTVSEENPLTSRTIVNRLWGRYMGNPLSSNTIDLGSQGTVPTHPGLLDWMASEFISSDWDLKHMIKLIVTSKTYMQSSDARQDLANIDPDNKKLFARQSSITLPAETIRDQVLAVSGLLHRKVGGPSVFPYQPAGHWESLNFPRRKWPTSKGSGLYRRGVYTWIQRTFPHPMMTTFDAPSRETCTGERFPSATPLQALALLNGPVFVESGRVLAQGLISKHSTDSERLDALYNKVLNREPSEKERTKLTTLLASQRKHFSDNPERAVKLANFGQSPQKAVGLDSTKVAAWTNVCRVVLNLYETMTRN